MPLCLARRVPGRLAQGCPGDAHHGRSGGRRPRRGVDVRHRGEPASGSMPARQAGRPAVPPAMAGPGRAGRARPGPACDGGRAHVVHSPAWPGRHPRVAIVGGGIAGLAAAWFLRGRAEVTILEAAGRIGGKLAVGEVAGMTVDVGAEALLARRPEGVGLVRQIGLGGELVGPGTTAARIWTRGAFRDLPRRQFMGVPADFAELERTGILSPEGLARARQDATLPATPRDGAVAVAGFVGARFGAEVVDRLVEPLLGGVYAGRPERLSFEATLPALAAESRRHASLAEAAAALLGPPPAPGPGGAPGRHDGPRPGEPAADGGRPDSEPGGRAAPAPAFATLAGGLGTLPSALAAASGAAVRTGAAVRELARTASGWRLVTGPASAPGGVDADAVILALPARPAGRLLAGVPGASPAAAALAEFEYASMAIVTLAYPAGSFPRPPKGSGYLVPSADGHPVKAVTFSTVKWPHLGTLPAPGGPARAAAGAGGEPARRRRPDRAGGGRPGRGDRSARPSRGGQRHPLGRRPAAVHGRPPRPGEADPRRRRRARRAGGLRRGLRRRRRPGLRRHGPAGRRPGARPPRGPARRGRLPDAGPGAWGKMGS